MVYHAEGVGGGLAIADELAIHRSFLGVQVVTKNLVEALQANAF
jgi:hypothetical protein